MREAIVLCGGKSLRLKGVAKTIKALMEYKEKAIIDWQVDWLRKSNVEKIVLACSRETYPKLKRHFGRSRNILYSTEGRKLGTSGAVKKALKLIKNNQFFVVNGDNISNVDLSSIVQANTMVVVSLKSPFGIVEVLDGTVVEFKEKPVLNHLMNAGIYYLNKSIPLVSEGDLEIEVFPRIGLKVYKHEGFWKTFDTPKDFEK